MSLNKEGKTSAISSKFLSHAKFYLNTIISLKWNKVQRSRVEKSGWIVELGAFKDSLHLVFILHEIITGRLTEILSIIGYMVIVLLILVGALWKIQRVYISFGDQIVQVDCFFAWCKVRFHHLVSRVQVPIEVIIKYGLFVRALVNKRIEHKVVFDLKEAWVLMDLFLIVALWLFMAEAWVKVLCFIVWVNNSRVGERFVCIEGCFAVNLSFLKID